MNTERDRDDYERWHQYGRDRGWFARMGDEVRSWFGDEEAERRRRIDEARKHENRSSMFMNPNEQTNQSANMYGGSGQVRNEYTAGGPGTQGRHEYGPRAGSYAGGGREQYGEHDRMEHQEWQQPQFNPYGSREQQYGGVHMTGGRMNNPSSGYHGSEHPYSHNYSGRTGETFFGRGPKNYKRSDERVRDEICQKLSFHPEIDATEIDVLVEGGEVTLIGMVHTRLEKRQAEELAEDVFGVNNVHNNIRVGAFQNQNQPVQQPQQTEQDRGVTKLDQQRRPTDEILDRPR